MRGAGDEPVADPARVLWLIEWLPEGSAFSASTQGGQLYRPWTTSTIVAVAQLNALNGANWQRAGGKGKRPDPVKPPEPVKRDSGGRAKRGMRKPSAAAARVARGLAAQTGIPPVED